MIFRISLLVTLGAIGLTWASVTQSEFHALGQGTITASGTPGCQFTPAGCTVSSQGTIHGRLIGEADFASSLTVAWAAATPNGAGGYCAPASGPVQVTADQGVLTLQEQGTVCEVGATAAQAPHTFNATFYVLSGTGRFENVQGTGTAVSSVNDQGKLLVYLNGTLSGLASGDAH
ncbi:MAG: hypothetical protein ACYC6M_12060 [Terriglobales bacterium]